MSVNLPTQSTKPINKDPRIFLLLSSTKTGKTRSCLQLPNSLLIDLEDGSEFYEGTKLNLRKESKIQNVGLGKLFVETSEAIQNSNTANNNKPVYDFIIIDTLTILEQLSKLKATFDYKKTLAGKNFVGKDVTLELGKGAGFAFMAKAFDELLSPYKGLAGKALILIAHKKLKTIEKESGEIDVNDIELTGKNKLLATSTADSIGYLYRNKNNLNQNILSFKKDEGDSVWGSRSPHLQNKKFIFSQLDKETDSLLTKWDLVFTSLKNDNTSEMVEVEDEAVVDDLDMSNNDLEMSDYESTAVELPGQEQEYPE